MQKRKLSRNMYALRKRFCTFGRRLACSVGAHWSKFPASELSRKFIAGARCWLGRTDLLPPDHDLPGGRLHVPGRELVVDVAAVVVRQGVLEPPRRPVLDVDHAADAKRGWTGMWGGDGGGAGGREEEEEGGGGGGRGS